MARRTAEDTAEAMAATGEGDPEVVMVETENESNAGTLLLGAVACVAVIVAGAFVLRAILPATDTDYAMLPDGYAERVGLVSETSSTAIVGSVGALPTPTPTPTVTGYGRSPFPRSRSQEPIIIEVDCPVGTVEIYTGERASDTVCIEGTLGGQNAPLVPVATPQIIIIDTGDGASIGGQNVPALDCTEDEVIAWTGKDTLGCAHYAPR